MLTSTTDALASTSSVPSLQTAANQDIQGVFLDLRSEGEGCHRAVSWPSWNVESVTASVLPLSYRPTKRPVPLPGCARLEVRHEPNGLAVVEPVNDYGVRT